MTAHEALDEIRSILQEELIFHEDVDRLLKPIETALNLTEAERKVTAFDILKRNMEHFIDFNEPDLTIYADCAINCKDRTEYDLLKEELEK